MQRRSNAQHHNFVRHHHRQRLCRRLRHRQAGNHRHRAGRHDADGWDRGHHGHRRLTTPGYTYQWLRTGSNISGATSNTYTLTSSDYGETIQVKVDFTDDGSNADSLTSDETLPVAPVAATCPTDTDTVWCATLTVGHSLDSDGDPSPAQASSPGPAAPPSEASAGRTFTHLGVNYTVNTVWGSGHTRPGPRDHTEPAPGRGRSHDARAKVRLASSTCRWPTLQFEQLRSLVLR